MLNHFKVVILTAAIAVGHFSYAQDIEVSESELAAEQESFGGTEESIDLDVEAPPIEIDPYSFEEEVKPSYKAQPQLEVLKETFSSDISDKEKLINFSAVYLAQWTYYLTIQHETIDKHGSFRNWYQYPFKPHYDKDNFDYNITKHSLTGNYYYLFYRSRGYTQEESFIWSSISSLVFEFTIETVTEQPSYQDMYQTPVFGTVLGVGSEKLSKYLLSKEAWYARTLGYILNPFVILPQTSDLFSTTYYNNGQLVTQVGWRF